MTRYHRDRDVTLVVRPAGPGMGFTRNCFGCKQNKIDRGGKTDKRTRMWHCAACIEAKAAAK